MDDAWDVTQYRQQDVDELEEKENIRRVTM